MGDSKIHLVVRNTNKVVAVCGLSDPKRYTRSKAAVVTCDRCTKAIQMADLELAARQSGKK